MQQKAKLSHERFGQLTYDDFKQMALDPNLSQYEKIGFPNEYRQETEEFIFQDILSKLTHLQLRNQIVLDIGPGCSQLPLKLIELCKKNNHTLILIDSAEMLALLPDAPFIQKIPGFFPDTCQEFISNYANCIDVILSYSVLHYIFPATNIFTFLDDVLSLIRSRGQALFGDIPNSSKRKRFLSSETGIEYHKQFYDPVNPPEICQFTLEKGCIDDTILNGLVLRSRASGFDAYWMPQDHQLPMANRREDLLILKP